MQTEIIEFQRDDFIISTDPARLNLAVIHDFLANHSYWVPGIAYRTVEIAVEHSLNFGLYYQGSQIGYARLLTDYARFAYLMDVFILEDYRGQGLGKWLMDCIFNHPELRDIQRWMLATWDAHTLYAQYGFVPLTRPDRFMEKVSPKA